jgi:hypothetical protein
VAEQTARSSDRQARDAKSQVEDLEARLDRLALACMAMWSLMQECTDLTEENLLERVNEIDLRDGRLDGKLLRQVKRCPKCDRVMSPRHTKCLYCGAPDLQATAFDGAL